MEPIPMVGRTAEGGELARAWARLASRTASARAALTSGGDNERPIIATITGPAGVGKSRLVATAITSFAPRPPTVYFGAARLHSPAPYDWLADILSQHGLSQPRPAQTRPEPSQQGPSGSGDERLEIAVPADALAWLRQDVAVPRERYAPEALLRIAVRIVHALVGAGPAVLVVEDLHALDPASLNLIAALATTPLPALLLVTSRPANAPMVADTLARLGGATGAVRQHLGPLDRDAVGHALVAAFGDGAATALDSVWQRTGGNPYELTELLATARDVTALHRPAPDLTPSDLTAPDLTPREIDVLSCLAAGMTNQQVASRLGISVRTVTVHVSNLLRKTRSRSRTDAALWAVRQQLPMADRSAAMTTQLS